MPDSIKTPESMVPKDQSVDSTFWLDAAQAAVRRECGWHVSPIITSDLTLDGEGGRRLVLPTKRLLDITSLSVNGAEMPTDSYDWAQAGIIELRRGFFPQRYRSVKVSITHGYAPEEIPDIIALVLQLSRRAAATPAGIVKSQSVNGASVGYDMSGGGAPVINLLDSEKEQLAPFRIGARIWSA